MVGRLRTLFTTSEVARTSLTALLIIAVRVGGTAATFAYTFVIARTMAPADVGLAWSIWSSSFIASTFTNLNIGSGAIRELVHARAHQDHGLASGFVLASRWVLLVASPFVMAAYFVFCTISDPAQVSAHWLAYAAATVSLPILGWVQVNASQAAALNHALHSQAPRELVRPILFLLAFGVALVAGYRPSIEFAILVYLAAIVITAILQYRLLLPAFAFMQGATPQTGHWRQWVATGLYLAPSRIISEHLKNLAIVCAAIGLSDGDTARFAIGLSLVTFLNFGISAVDMTFSPKISAAMAKADTGKRDLMLAVSGLLKLVPILVAGVIIVALAKPILALFGETYVQAAGATLWLVLMPFSKALFGPTELVLQVSGRRGIVFVTTVIGIAAIAIATAIAGSTVGLTAAAAAVSIAYALLQLLQWTLAFGLLGIDSSGLSRLALIRRRLPAALRAGA